MTVDRAADSNKLHQPLIVLDQAVREVEAAKGQTRLLLDRVSCRVYPGQRLAILASNQAEVDAFLSCASGVAPVQAGKVTIQAHVSWPLGAPQALIGAISGRANAAFLQRIYGTRRQRLEQMEAIRTLSDLEADFFYRPLGDYNSAMKARFRLALSLVFDFDVYTVPRLAAWSFGSSSSRAQRFQSAFETATAGKTLLVGHADQTFQDVYCEEGLVLQEGRVVFEGSLVDCRKQLKEQRQQRKANQQQKT